MTGDSPVLTLDRVNRMTESEFVAALGGVFEHSSWIAKQAFAGRPFPSVDALHRAMVDAVHATARANQIALLRAHPELAGRAARTLTADSTAEQRSAGLDALSRAEIGRIVRLNRAYREKFGFPFIIAVRRYSKDQIFSEFERRLANDPETELGNCLEQVYAIARLRLSAAIGS